MRTALKEIQVAMMKSTVTFISLLAFGIGARAQEFYIGSSISDVQRALGAPVGYFWRGYLYPSYPVTDETVYLEYSIRDATNEYEYRISYYSDNVASNLHPTARVSTIILRTDKAVVIKDQLARLFWARQFCELGCDARRLIPGDAILLTSHGDRSFHAMTLQAYLANANGNATDNKVRDTSSLATTFILGPFDYSMLPLMRGVKGGWKP